MSEKERVKVVNEIARQHLHDWLKKLENEEATADDLLGSLYGGMIASILLGYKPDSIFEDASIAAEKIIAMADEKEQNS